MYKKAWRKVVVLIIEPIGFVFFFLRSRCRPRL